MKTNVLQERNVNISCLEAIPYKVQALWSQEAQGQAALIWCGGAQHGATEDINWEGLRKLWELTLFTSCLCLSDGSVVSAWYASLKAAFKLQKSGKGREREKAPWSSSRTSVVCRDTCTPALAQMRAHPRSHRCVHTRPPEDACTPALPQMNAHLCSYRCVHTCPHINACTCTHTHKCLNSENEGGKKSWKHWIRRKKVFSQRNKNLTAMKQWSNFERQHAKSMQTCFFMISEHITHNLLNTWGFNGSVLTDWYLITQQRRQNIN